jgi:FdhE protein
VLAFYGHILALQERMARSMVASRPAKPAIGPPMLEQFDVELALRRLPELLKLVEKHGPAKLAGDATRMGAADETEQRQLLLEFLRHGQPATYSASSFFARVLFQAHAEFLAAQLTVPPQYSRSACPICGSKPQFAVLRPEGDGGKRHLACSLCLTEWQFRRIVCPGCEEADPTKLPRYSAEEPMAVRVEACDTCKSYQKSFDMTLDGLLVPEVDEIATVALDLWAAQHGYHKIQLNLLGF